MKKDLLDKLFSLRRFGIKPGLERINRILDRNGNPHQKIKVIHIAGTNGKGSVASLLASIFMEAGLKVGLYTSPHIFSFNERIKVNGIPISDNDLEPLVEKYIKFSEELNATFFEITTAIAFDYFSKVGTDVCVVETGMGGRYDATNVVDPLLSIITRIDLDHEEYLGRTIEEIAFEKAGIIKPNRTAIVSYNDSKVYQYLQNLKANEAKLIFVENKVKTKVSGIEPQMMKLQVLTEENSYSLVTPLVGKHQIENIAATIVAIEYLQKYFNISKFAVMNGVEKVRKNSGLYGRFEIINNSPLILVDVAHNPNSVEKTVELVKEIFLETKWNTIFASMRDKNYIKMLEFLLPITKVLFLPNLKYERAERNNIVYKKSRFEFEKFFPNGLEVVLTETSENAFQFAYKKMEPIFIIGSFYLLAELVPVLKKETYWDFPTNFEKLII
ncbi:MAG: bifunctional folylpolyglutamate synthase/dihydrofolate synthase [Ignavibacteria bacterium]|nr:bifunctional folylpolyglutamate synthase/dihydrofolate synthase [Ignavibacteria bacterium]